MEESDKLPLKRVELSLSKFNEVAIPHHLDLLRQHKANIIKHAAAGELARVRAEQARARRAAGQLRALLAELGALRRRVRPADLRRFDALSQRSRDLTLRAVVDYLGVIESSCKAIVAESRAYVYRKQESSPMEMKRSSEAEVAAGSAVSTDSVGLVVHDDRLEGPTLQLQLQAQDHEAQLREREAVLRGWAELQAELRALHDVWQHVQAAALAQRDQVTSTGAHVAQAAADVRQARESLALADRLRAGAYGAGGAALGALAAGPAGLLVGAKAGAAAALAGSLLGYLGARLLGARRLARGDGAPRLKDD